MPVNGFLKIPPDMSHPLPGPRRMFSTDTVGLCAGPCFWVSHVGNLRQCHAMLYRPCSLALSWGHWNALLKCKPLQQFQLFLPHQFPKVHDSVPRKVLQVSGSLKIYFLPGESRGKVRDKQCSWTLNRKPNILKAVPFQNLALKVK